MRDNGNQQFTYLPVQSGEWRFGLPLDCVVSVERINTTFQSQMISSRGFERGIPLLDLAAALQLDAASCTANTLLVIGGDAFAYGVLVESVGASHSAEWLPLPPLVERMGVPYSGLLRTETSLILALDPVRLMHRIPVMQPEGGYVS